MPRYFDRGRIAEVLDLGELIDAMERALVAFSRGQVIQPVRTVVHDPVAEGDMFLMPAVSDVFAIKIVANYPRNHERGIDSHHGLIVVFDRQTGVPQAILDGAFITQMRTAAVSAAAARRLSAPDAKVLAIMGSGAQARGHYQTMRLVRDFEEVRVWSRNPEHARAFASEIGAVSVPAREAVEGADVVATTTAAVDPIVKGEWLKPGAHVSAVGWNGTDGRELDDGVMRNLVLVESRESAMKESGNIILSRAKIHAELGEILAGRAEADPSRTTVFISTGIAAEDAYAAGLVLPKLLKP